MVYLKYFPNKQYGQQCGKKRTEIVTYASFVGSKVPNNSIIHSDSDRGYRYTNPKLCKNNFTINGHGPKKVGLNQIDG